jgi:UDP-glucuronate 4-epimerase
MNLCLRKKIVKTMEKQNLDNKYLKIYRGDVKNSNFVKKVLKNNQIDIVIHLAAMVGVIPSIENPKEY